ncbi:Aspartate--tRNA ligase 2, cytoplasmic [Linum perenne]
MSSSEEPQNLMPGQGGEVEDAALANTASSLSVDNAAADPLAGNYGNVSFESLQSGEKVDLSLRRTKLWELNADLNEKVVSIRGFVETVLPIGKNMAFVVVRQRFYTVQCVVTAKPDVVSQQMVKFVANLYIESTIQVEGVVSVPSVAITGATQQVEIQVRKLFCLGGGLPTLPVNIIDASRSEKETEAALEAWGKIRLNKAISLIKSEFISVFRDILNSEEFCEIFPPKLTRGRSERRVTVFNFEPVYVPQLHKQMAIAGGSKRVYSTTPVFRAEDFYTQFTSLDVEKEIDSHYSEVMDIVDRLFVAIFDRLNEKCKPSIEAVAGQYPFKPLKYLRKTLRLKFEEGIQMLKDAGVEVDPLEDLNTEAERKLGELVLQKYGTEFYILYCCPLNIRPFYTMPCQDDPKYSNSFDVFIRGEQAISGAQHIHDAGLLKQRARECGIDVRKISVYMNSFRNRCGMRPHGGFEMELEHAVKLFLGLNDYDVIQI